MLRGAEDHVLSVGDETYSLVSCLCVVVGNIRRVSSNHVLMCGRCDVQFSWRLVSRIA